MRFKQRRRPVYLSERVVTKSPCPNCSTVLEGVTQTDFDTKDEVPTPLNGHTSMCAYCGALLVFSDNAGRVRSMTEEERAAHEAKMADPRYEVQRRLFEQIRARAAARFMGGGG